MTDVGEGDSLRLRDKRSRSKSGSAENDFDFVVLRGVGNGEPFGRHVDDMGGEL